MAELAGGLFLCGVLVVLAVAIMLGWGRKKRGE